VDKARFREILSETLQLPPDERASYAENACGEDTLMLTAVTQALGEPAATSTAASDIDLEPGDIVGPYRILEPIGEGGMGVVFLAEQRQPIERKVALKVIKLGMDTKEILARFEAERQALALMSHPNVASVYDAGSTETGRPFFAMEYVPGIPITDYCDKMRLSIQERVELFRQSCSGVQHAHQKGIIHRDLKPTNMLVTEKTDARLVKIIDFGVAKSTQRSLTDKTLHTQIGVFIGTPNYTSPEQAHPDAMDIDTRTDVYSLGVILYELLVGSRPFDRATFGGKSMDEIQRIIREVEPPTPAAKFQRLSLQRAEAARARSLSPEKLQTRLKGDLSWVAMRALEKDRNARYPSASALDEDLDRYLNNEPVEARAQTTAYRARKFVRRHRLAVSITALAALLLVAVTTVSTYLYLSAERNFQMALAAADTLVDEVANAIEPLIGTQSETVRSILASASQIYDGLGDDPRAIASRADVLVGLSESYEKLGDLEAAEKASAESLALIKPLAAERPANLDWQHTLGRAHNRLGRVRVLQGQLEPGFANHSGALEIFQRLVDLDPNNAEWQLALGDALSQVGRIRTAQGKADEALPIYLRRLAIMQRLADLDATNTDWQVALAGAHGHVASMIRQQGDLDQALIHGQQRMTILEQLIAEEPGNAGWQFDLSSAHNFMANLARRQGNLDQAILHGQQQLKILELLTGKDPGNIDWQGSLAIAHGWLSGLFGHQGKMDQALIHGREQLRIMQVIVELDPTNTGWRWELGDAHGFMLSLLRRQGDLAGAQIYGQERLNIMQSLVGLDPSNSAWQAALANAHTWMTSVVQQQGKLDQARFHGQQWLDITQRLVEMDPSNTDWLLDLGNAHGLMASLAQQQDSWQKALQHSQERLAIMQRLTEKDPANPIWQDRLADTHHLVGTILEHDNNLDESLVQYQESLALHQSLSELDPSNAEWRSLLARAHVSIANIYLKLGDYDQALSSLKKDLEILETLLQLEPTNADLKFDRAIAHRKIGEALKAQGDIKAARASLKKAMEILKGFDNQFEPASEALAKVKAELDSLGAVE
jgi:serine/threonine protein kinase/Flp pilus assembly protein TadD